MQAGSTIEDQSVGYRVIHYPNLHLQNISPPTKLQTNSAAWVRDRTILTERPPRFGEVSANFADRGWHVVSVTDPYGRILGFLDQSPYFFFQAAPQLFSRGWVDPVPDPLLLRTSDSAGNQTRDLWICSQELLPLDHRGGPAPSNWRQFYSQICRIERVLQDHCYLCTGCYTALVISNLGHLFVVWN
jgi:hypothetical protein